MIREGNFFQNAFSAVFIKRGPATVFALKREHPVESALKTLISLLSIIPPHLAQRQQHHRRIVHIGVPLVLKLERPPARFELRWMLVLPSATQTDFLRHHLFRRT